MRAVQLMGVVGAMVFLIGWAGVSPARSELRAVVEDSTTIVVMRGDSVVFKKEMGFAREVSSGQRQPSQPGLGAIAVVFAYAPRDTVLINPLPYAHTFTGGGRGPRRTHLLLLDEAGDELFSADVPWNSVISDGVAMLSPDTLCLVYHSLGEFVVVDIPSRRSKMVRFSDKGCMCGDEEPCVASWIKPLGRDLVATRSDFFEVCGHGRLSEVALVSPDGVIHWRQEYPNEAVQNLAIDPQAEVVAIGSRVGPPEWGNRLRAISRGGEVLWEEPVKWPMDWKLEAGGGVVRLLSPSGETLLVRDSKTGKPVEGQP